MTPEADKPTSVVVVEDVAVNNNNNHSNGGGGGGDGGDESSKTPRLPRWTRHEILVLIEGKRVAEGQVRRGRSAAGSNQPEPKWVAISSYCKRHGVYREPVQCRKRWSNLAGDFRKIKEWEGQVKDESDSFWIMRNDLRRERKLPGFFDREIFDVLNGRNVAVTGTELVPVTVEDWKDKEGAILGLAASVVDDDDDEDTVFDSGRTAAPDDGLFSDFEHSKQDDDEMGEMGETPNPNPNTTPTPNPILNTTPTPNPTTPIAKNTTFPAPVPISERRYEPVYKAFLDRGRMNVKQPTLNPERGSPSREGQKRRRVSAEDGEDATLQDQLVKVLESNNKMLAAQLEAQNVNCHLDRDQRKEQGNGLIAVLNKLADALGKIADKM